MRMRASTLFLVPLPMHGHVHCPMGHAKARGECSAPAGPKRQKPGRLPKNSDRPAPAAKRQKLERKERKTKKKGKSPKIKMEAKSEADEDGE